MYYPSRLQPLPRGPALKITITASDKTRIRELGTLVRSGRATPAEENEFDALDHKFQAAARHVQELTPPPRSIFDLPIAARMWADDARELERSAD